MSNFLRVGLIIVGIFVGLSFLFVGISFFIFAGAISSSSDSGDEAITSVGERIAIVEVNDVITNSEKIVSLLKKYDKNSGVKAIVVRVESPGGGVAASQEIYEEIRSISKSKKPVVISMGGIAASGGYYISLGADRIVANEGTLIGSIGVIMQFPNLKSLFNKLGIDMITITSGKLKDAGSPFREPTKEDQKYFQSLIDNTQEQFVNAVVQNRKLSKEEVLKIADGRVFTGKQAFEMKLVDTLGTFEDAINIAAKLGGIKGEPKIIRERKKMNFWERISSEVFASPLTKIERYLEEPILKFKYNN